MSASPCFGGSVMRASFSSGRQRTAPRSSIACASVFRANSSREVVAMLLELMGKRQAYAESEWRPASTRAMSSTSSPGCVRRASGRTVKGICGRMPSGSSSSFRSTPNRESADISSRRNGLLLKSIACLGAPAAFASAKFLTVMTSSFIIWPCGFMRFPSLAGTFLTTVGRLVTFKLPRIWVSA